MIARPQLASDARLYISDDAGLVFSEVTQNLYVLNATAAFIWSCFEDGLERDQIVAAVEGAYSVSAQEARSRIDELLRDWQRLGLLAGGTSYSARRPLRDEAGDEEHEDLLTAESLRDAPSASHSERSYRLLTTSFRLRYATAAQEAAVHPVFAHLSGAKLAAERMATVDLAWWNEEHLLLINGHCVQRCVVLNELAPLVKSALLEEAVNNWPSLICIHAGVVRTSDGCLLLPAAAGSGKTSLTAALIRKGFIYLSDEYALLEKETLRVRPLPISLCVKDGAWDLLASRYPELCNLVIHHRWDDKNVRYLNPPPDALDPEPEKSHAVRWIIFPRYTAGAATELRPLGRADALHRLLGQCATPNPLDHAKVADLIQWIGGVACFEMPMSSLDEAVVLVDKLCRAGSR